MRLDLANIIMKKQGNKRCSSAGGSTRVPAGAVTSLNELSGNNKQCSSAGRLSSSTAGAVTSLIFGVMFGGILGLSSVMGSNNTYAADSSITITVSDNVSVDAVPSETGRFSHNAGTVSVITNHVSGYTLTIAASSDSDNGALTSTNGTIPTINATCMGSGNSSITSANFSSRSECNDMWGYAPSYYNSVANSNYYPAPNTTGDVLDITNSANPTAKTYSIDIGTKITGSTAPGSYTKTFVINAIGNQIPYTIAYNDSVASGMPGDVSGSTDASTITLDSAVPTTDGYEFVGWCTVVPTRTNNIDACTGGTQYAAGATYSLSSGTNVNLYAMWKRATPYIQDYDLATCAAEASDNVTVKDKRDDNEYTVKYINNECWMTQNLRYLGDTGSAAGTMTIGGNNSNVSNTSITLYSLDSSDAGNFGAYSGHCNSTYGYNYACVYDSGSDTTGVWYNYYAASGGTISGSSNSTAASNDICPSGWHLPSSPNTTAGTDYNKLVGNTTSGYQNPTAGLTAFGAVAGGYYDTGSLLNTEYGYWWSATARTATYRYTLNYNSSDGQFRGDVSFYRYLGRFVRCVRSS